MTNAVSTLTAISIPFIRRYNSAVLYFKEKMSANFQLDENIGLSESKSLWVFGYGSLCWRPGFEFDKAVIGHIKGFSRKFWQGNDVHRGTQEKVIINKYFNLLWEFNESALNHFYIS